MLFLHCALCSTGIVNSLVNKNPFITLEYVKRKNKTFEIQKCLGIIETSNT